MTTFAGLFEVTALGKNKNSSKEKINFTDIVLLVLFAYVVYKLFLKKHEVIERQVGTQIEPLKEKDMTVEELRRYNGIDDEHICLAICGKVHLYF
jgi:hypothetical protein